MKVIVKWNKEKYELDLELDSSVELLKAQLYSLTDVEPERMKLLCKGKFLKDDTDLSSLGIKEGQLITMMGTVGSLPKAPAQTIQFLEDMTEEETAVALELPTGLTNLGNTCYMNASVQVLRAMPELMTFLKEYNKDPTSDPHAALVTSFKELLIQLEKGGTGVPPFQFLKNLRQAYPKFSQMGQQGVPAQQDAEECFTSIVQSLRTKLKSPRGSFVEDYLSGTYETTMKTAEAPDEAPLNGIEPFYKLDCHISKDVSHLTLGIEEALKDEIEKNSPTLGRSAIYTKEFKISRLPYYLPINFVRFFWKPKEKIKAKILKKVKFPMELDLYPYCTKSLQNKLDLARAKMTEFDEDERNKRAKLMDDAITGYDERKKAIYEAADPELKAVEGTNYTGYYELSAVLTHTGRTADSGHYIAWIKKETNQWLKFDDDTVTLQDDAAIKNLDGGGDWHMAYILLYSKKLA